MASNQFVNCSVGRYHEFRVVSGPYGLTKTFSKDQKEYCRHCKVTKSYKFQPDGKMIDEHGYWLDHIRHFAQPSMGDVYFEINSGMKDKFLAEEREKKGNEDRNAERSDKFKFSLKRSMENRDDGMGTNKG